MFHLRLTRLQVLSVLASLIVVSMTVACDDKSAIELMTGEVSEADAGPPGADNAHADAADSPDVTRGIDAPPVEPDVSAVDGGSEDEADAETLDPEQICSAWGDTTARCLLDDCPGVQAIASELAEVNASLCREGEANEPGFAQRYADVDSTMCDDVRISSYLSPWRRMTSVQVMCRLGGALNPRHACEAACERLLSPCGDEFPHRELPSAFDSRSRLQVLCRISCAGESVFAEELACLAETPAEISCNESVAACVNERTIEVPALRVYTNQGHYDLDGTFLLFRRERNPLSPREGSLSSVRARIFDAQDQLLLETGGNIHGGSAYRFFTTLPPRAYKDVWLMSNEEALPAPPAKAEVVLVWRHEDGFREDPPVVLPVEGPETVSIGQACPTRGVITQCEEPLVCDYQHCLPEE